MSYRLGVDLGTTFTAAAVARDGRVEMATLGDHTDAVPSVVLIRADGTVLTGGASGGGSGETVSFSIDSGSSAVCSVSGGTVTFNQR